MHIIPLYASLLSLLFVALSIKTIRLRRELKIGVGDGGNAKMTRAMRVHSNFAEYVPLCLLMFLLAEFYTAPTFLLHFLGAGLLIGRLSHAYGVSQLKENFVFRISGMLLTFTTLLLATIYVLFSYTR